MLGATWCAAIVLCVSSLPARAESIWVDASTKKGGDGSASRPFARICDGVTAANDTISVRPVQVLVRPGTYASEELPIVIERPRTMLIKVGAGRAVIAPPRDYEGDVVLVSASRVVVAGFAFAGPSGGFAVAARGRPEAPLYGVGIVDNETDGYFGGVQVESASGWAGRNTLLGGHVGILVTGGDRERGGSSWRIYDSYVAGNDIGLCFIGGLDVSNYFDGIAPGGPLQVAGAVHADIHGNVIEGQLEVAFYLLYRGIFPIIDQPAELDIDFHDNVVVEEPDVLDIALDNIQGFFLQLCGEAGAPGSASLALADNDFGGTASANFSLGYTAYYRTMVCGPMAAGTSAVVSDPDGSIDSGYSLYNPPDSGATFTLEGPASDR